MTDEQLQEFAKQCVGNWLKFDSFMAGKALTELAEGQKWAVLYTSSRDSTLLEESNAAAFQKALQPFLDAYDEENDLGDAFEYGASHWAVGHIDGYAIRVYDKVGNITDAFRKYAELHFQIRDVYPVLDQDDYSQRGYDATWKNVMFEIKMVENKFDLDLTDEQKGDIFHKLMDDGLDTTGSDDKGGYADSDEIEEVLVEMGILVEETEDAAT